MKRFALIALLSALSLGAYAQGDAPPPPRGEPGRPGGDDPRRKMHDRAAAIDDRLAEIEKRFSDKTMSKEEEEKLRKEATGLQEERRRLDEGMRRGGPPDGQEPGGPDGPPRPGGPFGPGGGPGGPGGRPGRAMAVSAEDREKAMAWLKENEPVRLERLNELKESRPQEYERAVNQTAAEIRELLMMKQNDPDRYARRMDQRKLEYRSNELAEKIKALGENQDSTALRKELTDILSKLFDLREADREQELKNLEEELVRLKETMKKRKASKDEIVKRRLEELCGDNMEWEPGGGGPGPGGQPPPPKDR